MEDEKTEQWLERINGFSEWMAEQYIALQEWDDTFGWGGILQAMRENPPPYIMGILLAGPEGCGRHTAAAHMVMRLREEGFGFAFLSGEDLSPGSGGFSITEARLERLTDDFYDLGKGLCLVLERLDACTCQRELMDYLGRTVGNYWINREEYPPLFLILIADTEEGLPALLRRHLQICRMSLPDSTGRESLLSKQASGLERYIPPQRFAELTEGYTYAQLSDVIQAAGGWIDTRIKQGKGISEEAVAAFLESQSPQRATDDLRLLMTERIIGLLEDLPEILKSIASSVANGSVGQDGEKEKTSLKSQLDTFVDAETARINQLSPREVAEELWGVEGVERMLQNIQKQREEQLETN